MLPITFQNVTVSGGVKMGGSGGALKTDGSVDVINSTFSNNQALHCADDYTNSDVATDGYCSDPYGGAIYADNGSKITVTASTVTALEIVSGIRTMKFWICWRSVLPRLINSPVWFSSWNAKCSRWRWANSC